MRRPGVILLEVIVACGLAALLLAVCLQVFTLMAVERRAVERRAIALQEAANLLEQAAAIPYEQLTAEKLRSLSIDPALATLLPDAKTSLSVDDEQEPLPAKRVAVELSWLGAGRRREAPIRLTTWVFAPPAAPAAGEAQASPETPAVTSPSVTPPAVIPPAGSVTPLGTAVSPSEPAGPAVLPAGSADETPSLQSGGSP